MWYSVKSFFLSRGKSYQQSNLYRSLLVKKQRKIVAGRGMICGSSCARASYTSSSVNEMLLNYIVGTCREETGGSLKLLLVKVELKNLLNSSAFCWGSRII